MTAYPKETYRRPNRPRIGSTKVAQVIARDGECVLRLPGCTRSATCADHRAGRGAGGSEVLNELECLVAACRSCNGAKEDADKETREELIGRGLRVEKDSTNEKTVTRCRMMPVKIGDQWYSLEGVVRVPIPVAHALARAVLAGAQIVSF